MASLFQQQTSTVLQCPMCSFLCSDPIQWLAHLRSTNHQEEFNVSCCFSDCSHDSSFKTFSALKSHIYRTHYEKEECSEDTVETTQIYYSYQEEEEDAIDIRSHEVCHTTQQEMIEADIVRLLHADTDQQKHESALFVMRLREINRLPQSVIDDIVSSSRSLFGNTFKRLYAGVRQRIAETGHDIDISDIFDDLQDPFAGLDTAYLQEQYINTEFKVLVSAICN